MNEGKDLAIGDYFPTKLKTDKNGQYITVEVKLLSTYGYILGRWLLR